MVSTGAAASVDFEGHCASSAANTVLADTIAMAAIATIANFFIILLVFKLLILLLMILLLSLFALLSRNGRANNIINQLTH